MVSAHCLAIALATLFAAPQPIPDPLNFLDRYRFPVQIPVNFQAVNRHGEDRRLSGPHHVVKCRHESCIFTERAFIAFFEVVLPPRGAHEKE